MVGYWKKLALGSKNDWVDLIRRFGSERRPYQWYLLTSRKYKKGDGNFTFLGITKVPEYIIQKRVIVLSEDRYRGEIEGDWMFQTLRGKTTGVGNVP